MSASDLLYGVARRISVPTRLVLPPVHLPRSRAGQPIDGIRAIELALRAVLRVCLIDGAEAVLQAEVVERPQGHAEPCRRLRAREQRSVCDVRACNVREGDAWQVIAPALRREVVTCRPQVEGDLNRCDEGEILCRLQLLQG